MSNIKEITLEFSCREFLHMLWYGDGSGDSDGICVDTTLHPSLYRITHVVLDCERVRVYLRLKEGK
jgi:hypothetical protein